MIALWVAIGALGGAALVRYGWPWRREPGPLPLPGEPPADRGEAVRRVLKHLQRKSIGELTEGNAGVVVGTVHALEGVEWLVAPISATPCLGYHLDIRRAWLDVNSPVLRQLHDEARCVRFEVRDETGSVLVDPEGLELAITDGPIGRWDPPLPPEVHSRVPPLYATSPVTVEEGLLLPGARILVCGVVARDAIASDYRDGKTHLVLRASATFPLVASTDADLLTQGERPIAPEELHRR